MQFLTITRLDTGSFDPEKHAAILQEERHLARSLYMAGIIRQIWYRGDTGGACIIFESDSEEEVRKILASLPLAKANLLDIAEFIPIKPYAGFGPN